MRWIISAVVTLAPLLVAVFLTGCSLADGARRFGVADGIVVDTDRSYYDTVGWQRTGAGPMTVTEAQAYCDTLALGGYTDWALPLHYDDGSGHDLEQLYDYNLALAPYVDRDAFPDISCTGYWELYSEESGKTVSKFDFCSTDPSPRASPTRHIAADAGDRLMVMCFSEKAAL